MQLGTVLEHFDAVGAYRDEIAAFSFDTGSDYTNLFPVDATVDILNMGSVTSPGEMIDLIAGSEEATSCFAERLSQYTFGDNGSVAGCEADTLTENLKASGGDMRAAILSLITSAKFQQRIAGDQ